MDVFCPVFARPTGRAVTVSFKYPATVFYRKNTPYSIYQRVYRGLFIPLSARIYTGFPSYLPPAGLHEKTAKIRGDNMGIIKTSF